MDRAVRVFRRGLCTHTLTNGKMSAANVRKTFIEYFERDHNHLLIPSSSVMPDQDPTLSFVNSGMNQFKRVFLGEVIPASNRVVNSQKCVRIKGKHNDLSQVGHDGTHHTFFEMLGNWSFGDYFKREACRMSWSLLTEVYKIPAERLYVTYFKGDEDLNLPPDLETMEIWAEIGVPKNRILPFGMGENFWEMASCGPCGPCTEIHYDHVEGRSDASSLVNSGSPEVTELWNLVFTEFNRTQDGSLSKLKQHFVDTGMGFERLVAVVQGQTSNYETDLFRPLFDVIQKTSGHSGYTGTYGDNEMDVAYRTLADHSRMITVTLSDGLLPNIQNRIRAVFRRALSISRRTFNIERGLIKELSNHVAEALSPVYPEIGRNLDRVHYIIDEEEESIIKRDAAITEEWFDLLKKYPDFSCVDLDEREQFINGFKYVEKSILRHQKKKIDSEDAWKLVDTYGVPVETVKNMAKVTGLNFNVRAYNEFLKDHLERERVLNESRLLHKTKKARTEIPMELKATDDSYKFEFEKDSKGNFEFKDLPVKVLAISVDGKTVEKLAPSTMTDSSKIGIFLDKTNLYHKSEDHRSDSGILELNGLNFKIFEVEKFGDKIIHYGRVEKPAESYEVAVEDEGLLRVNKVTRTGIIRGNTAVHLLKCLLSKRMKTFVEGESHAGIDKFRFSFCSYNESLQLKDILELEKIICHAIKDPFLLEKRLCSPKEVQSIENLIARSGRTFVAAGTPVARIFSPFLCASFPYSGPIADDIATMEDFLITDYRPCSGYKMKEICGFTGEKAKVGRSQNKEMLEKWQTIRNFHLLRLHDPEAMKVALNDVTSFIGKLKSLENLSYYVKEALHEEANAKLDLLNKYVRRELRMARYHEKRGVR